MKAAREAPIARWLAKLKMQPVGPEGLAISRLLFYFWIAIRHVNTHTAAWLPFAELDFKPVWLLKVLGLHFVSAWWLNLFDTVWMVALVFAGLGLFTRVSTTVSFVLGTYLLALPHCVGKAHHSDAIVLFALAAFSLSRCGDALSIDAWLARRRGAAVERAPSTEYAWLAWFGLTCIVIVYCSAGIAKLRASGLQWAWGEGNTTRFISHQYTHEPPTRLGLKIVALGEIGKLGNWFALALEVFSPVAFLHRYARFVVLGGLFVLQISIYLTLGVFFDNFFALFAMCVPWGAVYHEGRTRFERWRPKSQTPAA
jgi:hypothetical protein